MGAVIWRGRCPECGADMRRHSDPPVRFAMCPYAACHGFVDWTRWEVVESSTFAAFVIDASGDEHGCGTWSTLEEARDVLRPGGNFVSPGEETRIVKKTTRTLRKVK